MKVPGSKRPKAYSAIGTLVALSLFALSSGTGQAAVVGVAYLPNPILPQYSAVIEVPLDFTAILGIDPANCQGDICTSEDQTASDATDSTDDSSANDSSAGGYSDEYYRYKDSHINGHFGDDAGDPTEASAVTRDDQGSNDSDLSEDKNTSAAAASDSANDEIASNDPNNASTDGNEETPSASDDADYADEMSGGDAQASDETQTDDADAKTSDSNADDSNATEVASEDYRNYYNRYRMTLIAPSAGDSTDTASDENKPDGYKPGEADSRYGNDVSDETESASNDDSKADMTDDSDDTETDAVDNDTDSKTVSDSGDDDSDEDSGTTVREALVSAISSWATDEFAGYIHFFGGSAKASGDQ